jgi:hypothetical protein
MSGRNLTGEDGERKYGRVCEDWIEEYERGAHASLLVLGNGNERTENKYVCRGIVTKTYNARDFSFAVFNVM